MLTRREVIEHLAAVLGVREPLRLRRLTREFFAYRERWHAGILRPAPSAALPSKTALT